MHSGAFSSARMSAGSIVDDPAALRSLVRQVDRIQFAVDSLRDHPEGIKVDMACAIVEAHAEELELGSAARSGSASADARIRLVTAALCYLVKQSDAIPDDSTYGYVDDLVVLDVVISMALGRAA